MARVVRQTIPKPPPIYDQGYIAQLADAINEYMFQREALAEQIAARFIMVDPTAIDPSPPAPPPAPAKPPIKYLSNTQGLPTGMLILKPLPGQPAGTYYLTVVTNQDQK